MAGTQRWVGIDEAGYGPNLGPLVMCAVMAEGPAGARPDPWRELPERVGRANASRWQLALDDSKRLHQGPRGRERLEGTAQSLLQALGFPPPHDTAGLFRALNDGASLAEVELDRWLGDETSCPPVRLIDAPFAEAPWRLLTARAEVVAPGRFNAGLSSGRNKADVHFDAFVGLLRWAWSQTTGDAPTHVIGDKHGGRHFYLDRLTAALPGVWIDRGPEGPDLSAYAIREGDRRLDLELRPRSDGADGLVAMASIFSKTLRERWMDAFNAYWRSRIPGLSPTAGYPLDARRFRREIEPLAGSLGLPLESWWRLR